MAANRANIKAVWIKDMVDLAKFSDISIDLTFDDALQMKEWLISHE
jgi:hypothetical protein